MHQTISTPYNQRRVAALMMATVQLLLLSFHKSTTTAFQTNPPINIIRPQKRSSSSTTTLFLEDHIANMIDNEMRRLYQKQETQSHWEARQRALQAEIHVIPDNYNFDAEFDDSSSSVVGFSTSGVDRSTTISGRTRRRDEKMVEDDPMRYCADRCVSTGNCDVFEDMFDMGPEEVIKFCTECVLSEDETPCDVPANLFEDDNNEEIESGGGGGGLHP